MSDGTDTPFDQGLFLVHLNRGRERFDQRQFAAAELDLEAARKLRPNDQTVLNLLGLAYFRQEKYREADAIYRQLIEGNPESHVLYFNHGLICFKLGALDRAESAFLQALELAPDNQKINFYLGNIYEKKNQYYNAIFQYRKAGANIMVKRVQEKIMAERSASTGESDDSGDDTSPKLEGTIPPTTETTAPRLRAVIDSEVEREENPAHDEEAGESLKVTVDHIDRERFLTALRTGSPLRSRASTSSGRAPPAHASPSEPARPASPPPAPAAGEDIFSIATEALSKQADESSRSPGPPGPSGHDDEPRHTETVIRLTEPVVDDQPLSEMARSKALSSAGTDLFSSKGPRRGGSRRSPEDTLKVFSAPSADPGRAEPVPHLRRVSLSDREEHEDRGSLYSRLRRRDDIFRYLEDNLMEVNFSGKVFIKQGTIYSYSGNLNFWVKPQRHEGAPPLVIVSGTGKLLLTDRHRDITVMQIEDEEVFVEPSHLLACQESLTPRYAIIEREGFDKQKLHVLCIEGSGMIALSVATSPLLLTVTPGYPVNVSSASVISWSGQLNPSILEDEALAELMLPHEHQALNLRLEGSGKVMMEKF